MPGPKPKSVVKVTRCIRRLLKRMLCRRQLPQCWGWRIQIILLANRGFRNSRIARRVGKDRATVRLWRTRWVEVFPALQAAEQDGVTPRELTRWLESVFADAPRSGAPGKFTPEQWVTILAVACEPPQQSKRPISHWTPRELADEVVQRKIVTAISPRSVGRFLAEADLKPHQSRYWLNRDPEDDPAAFAQAVQTVCDVYAAAPQLHQAGVVVVSTDEKTGIQALERKYPSKPMQPGRVELQEFEYIRHGTQCLIVNFQVATGTVIAPTVGPTRTEQDFVKHIQQTVATHPDTAWIFIVDQLNTHMSESLVKLVARVEGLDEATLGVKGASGVLKSMATRKAFLEDARHRIRFVYTPTHTSWLNQVEIWLSILVRKLLKRASFASVEELRQRILQFIEYFNRTMAKPFKWTYTGRPLTV